MVSLMINGNIQDSYNTTHKKTFSYFPLYTDNHFSQLLQSRVYVIVIVFSDNALGMTCIIYQCYTLRYFN